MAVHLIDCFKYLNIQFFGRDNTFVKLHIKENVNYFTITAKSGEVDTILEYVLNFKGFIVLQSNNLVKSTFPLRKPIGLVCIKNIEFNVVDFPANIFPLNPTTCTDEQMFSDITEHLFGQHIGAWRENVYTAILSDFKFPIEQTTDIFVEMENIMAVSQLVTIDFCLIAKSLNKLDFKGCAHIEWWNVYFQLINRCIDQQSKLILPMQFNLDKLIQSDWKTESINMTRYCEICLTEKHDIGVLFSRKRTTVKYVSSMLTCFTCFISNSHGIKDCSFQLCSNWLPLSDSILGMVLFHKCGEDKFLKDVILYLLRKQTLNEKELFISECLFNVFNAFNVSMGMISSQLYGIIDGVNCMDSDIDYVQRLTCTSGTLKSRLYHAYSCKEIKL